MRLRAAEAEIRKVSQKIQHNQIFEEDSFQKTIGNLIENQKNESSTFFDYNIDKYIDWSIIATKLKIQLCRIL